MEFFMFMSNLIHLQVQRCKNEWELSSGFDFRISCNSLILNKHMLCLTKFKVLNLLRSYFQKSKFSGGNICTEFTFEYLTEISNRTLKVTNSD